MLKKIPNGYKEVVSGFISNRDVLLYSNKVIAYAPDVTVGFPINIFKTVKCYHKSLSNSAISFAKKWCRKNGWDIKLTEDLADALEQYYKERIK